jgi:hypothetical protein
MNLVYGTGSENLFPMLTYDDRRFSLTPMVKLRVNNATVILPAGFTLADLVEALCQSPKS